MADETTLPDAPGGEAPAPAETLRDDVARAFEEIETRDAPPAPEGTVPAGVAAPATGERARGPDGKFIPAPPAPGKPPEKPAGAPELAAPPKPKLPPTNGQQRPPEAPKAPDPAAPTLRPPASWKPGAREHWAKLPPDVQQEVVRRETEVARSMQESAKAREALTHVQQVLGPYAHNITATGRDALGAMNELFRADNTLRHGSIAEKAALVADIVKSYGVDIVALDSALSGAQPESTPEAMLADKLRREMQQQLQPVMQYFGQLQGRRQNAMQQINTDAASEVETFATDGAHEFFEDVRADMADIIDLYTQRGASISLQDAYDRAIKLNPQVSEIVAKRAESERASAAAQAAQRARRAAASITSAPAPAGAGPGPAGDSRRAEIEAAWDSSSGS